MKHNQYTLLLLCGFLLACFQQRFRCRRRRLIRADQKLTHTPIIALSAMISPAAIERGRLAGFHDYVAKFDRPGLIAALKEQTADMNRAA